MKLVVRFILLQCLYLNIGFGQIIDRAAYQCNVQQILEEYLERDAVQAIKEPYLLYEMADIAYDADQIELSQSFLKRLVEQEAPRATLIYYQAKLSQCFFHEADFNLNALRNEVSEKYGVDHECLAVIDLVEADRKIRRREAIRLDSIIDSAISRIENFDQYKRYIAVSYQNLSKYYAARGEVQKGLAIARQVEAFLLKYFADCEDQFIGTYVTLGRRHLNAAALDSAMYYFQMAYDFTNQYHPRNFQAQCMAAINVADAYSQKGQTTEALRMLGEAKDFALQNPGVDDSYLITIYNNMGLNYKASGDRYKAIEYFRKSILISEKRSDQPSAKKLAAYFNVGTQFYQLKDYELAQKYYDEALDLSLTLVGENHLHTAIVLMSLGSIQLDLGNYKAVEKYFNRSLKIRKKLYGAKHSSVSNVYVNYALMYLDQRNNKMAADYIEQAIQGYEDHLGPVHPKVASAYMTKARVVYSQGDYEAVYRTLEQAKKALGYNGVFKSSSDHIFYLDIVQYEAMVRLQDFKNNRNGTYAELEDAFEQAMEVFQYALVYAESINELSELSADYHSLFDYYVEMLVLRAEATSSEIYLEEAFKINNIGKNLGLKKALNQRTQLLFSNVPKTEREQLNILKGKIKAVDQRIAKLPLDDQVNRRPLLDSLEQLQERLLTLNLMLQKEYPAFNQIAGTEIPLDLKNFIPDSRSGLAIVDYRIVDSTLITFVLSKSELSVKRKNIGSEFSDQLNTFLQKNSQAKNNQEQGEWLQVLTDPLADLAMDIDRLLIIPDEYLSRVPFELLKIGEEYLVEKYAVTYANSASIYEMQKALKTDDNEYSFAGFAPDYSSPVDTTDSPMYAAIVRSGNWSLPFAEEEVKHISNIWTNSKIYLGEQATKEELLAALGRTDIIHLSMHAEANWETPMNSRFIFNTQEDKEEQDLLLYELYHLNASAKMVVLSACETGSGTFHQGEGVRSLGNGFLYAGVPAVLMSLWKVPDESTSKIMKSFYEYLKDGQTKDVALQKAKLDYLERTVAPELRHPYYWAGFVLSGDEAPIASDTAWTWKTILLVIGLCLVLLWFLNINS